MNNTIVTIIVAVIAAASGGGAAAWYIAIKGGPQREASWAETAVKAMQATIDTMRKQNELQAIEIIKLRELDEYKAKKIIELTESNSDLKLDMQTLRNEFLLSSPNK